MATTNPWLPGFSENPAGQPLAAGSTADMLARIGDEVVTPPAVTGEGLPISRRELLARVLWTRAIVDADTAVAKLIMEYADARPADPAAPLFTADDYAQAEKTLQELPPHDL